MARSMRSVLYCCVLGLVCAAPALATIFGNLRGTVDDPQGRAVRGATVLLQAQASDWTRQMQTDAQGRFEFPAVPVGDYVLTVVASGFNQLTRSVTIASSSAAQLDVKLQVAGVQQSVTVSAKPARIDTGSSTTQTVVSHADIADTPGASRANSLAMITDF